MNAYRSRRSFSMCSIHDLNNQITNMFNRKRLSRFNVSADATKRMEPVSISDIHSDVIWDLKMNSRFLVSASADRTSAFYDFQNSNNKCVFYREHQGSVNTVEINPEGKHEDFPLIATGSGDCAIHLWKGNNINFCITTLRRHTKPVSSISWTFPKYILSGSYDTNVHLWNLDSVRIVSTFHHDFPVYSVSLIHPLFVSGSGKQILLWDLRVSPSTFISKHEHSRPVNCTLFISDTLYAYSAEDGSVLIWDTRNFHSSFINIACSAPANRISVIGNLVAVPLDSGILKFYDLTSGQKVASGTSSSCHKALLCSALGSNNLAASGSLDGRLYFWDTSALTSDKIKNLSE